MVSIGNVYSGIRKLNEIKFHTVSASELMKSTIGNFSI